MFFLIQIQSRGKGLFRPFLPLVVGQQGKVRVGRCGNAEALLQIDLARRGNEQVLTADNMGYSLIGIIGNYGKLICPIAVGTKQDEIADVVCQILCIMSDNAV